MLVDHWPGLTLASAPSASWDRVMTRYFSLRAIMILGIENNLMPKTKCMMPSDCRRGYPKEPFRVTQLKLWPQAGAGCISLCLLLCGPGQYITDGNACNTTHPGPQYSLIPPTFPMEKAVSKANNDDHDKSTTNEIRTHSRSITPAEGHTILSPNSPQARDDNALTIDWDGPDDPENPRK